MRDYDRLLALVRGGDAEAAAALELEARRRHDHAALIDALTAQPPSEARWRALLQPLEEADDALLERAQSALTRWPSALRVAPRPWLERALRGTPPRALALAHVAGLEYHAVSPSNLRALLAAMPELRELELIACDIGDAEVTALAQHPGARHLHDLNLFDNGVSDAGALALARSPHLNDLRRLNLIDNPIHERGAIALFDRFRDATLVLEPADWSELLPVHAPTRAHWRRICQEVDAHVPPSTAEFEAINLDMRRWNPGFRVAPAAWTQRALDGHPHPRTRLTRTMRVDARHRLSPDSLRALAEDPHLLYLERFTLEHVDATSLTPDDAAHLARATFLPTLRVFALQHLRLGPAELDPLLTPLAPDLLGALALGGNAADDATVERIVTHLPHLHTLILFDNDLTDTAAERIARHLPRLRTLSLKGNAITGRGLEALRRHPRLRQVDLRRTRIRSRPSGLPSGWRLPG